MHNISTACPITHIVLIDSESSDHASELIKNMVVVQNGLKDFFGEWRSHYYLTRIVAPASRNDIANLCIRLKPDLKSQGVDLSFVPITNEDMLLFRGKVGLLTYSFSLMAGNVLLNDSPVSSMDAMKLPWLSRQLQYSGCQIAVGKKGFFTRGFRFALFREGYSIGHLLLGTAPRLADGHTLNDLIAIMKANCKRGDVLCV